MIAVTGGCSIMRLSPATWERFQVIASGEMLRVSVPTLRVMCHGRLDACGDGERLGLMK
jgi:hypothetical protein